MYKTKRGEGGMEIKCILSAAVLELVLRRNFSVKNEERQTPHKQPKKNKRTEICGRNETFKLINISDAIHVIQFTTN